MVLVSVTKVVVRQRARDGLRWHAGAVADGSEEGDRRWLVWPENEVSEGRYRTLAGGVQEEGWHPLAYRIWR